MVAGGLGGACAALRVVAQVKVGGLLLLVLLILLLLLMHDGEAARCRVHGHHHGLAIGVVVEDAGVVVVKGDVHVQDHH